MQSEVFIYYFDGEINRENMSRSTCHVWIKNVHLLD